MICRAATARVRRVKKRWKTFGSAIGEYLAAQPEIEKRFGTRVTREEVNV
jgi:hypothetical protein